MRKPLYDRQAAEFCQSRELAKRWVEDDETRVQLILEHLGDAASILDIGCGWGMMLAEVAKARERRTVWLAGIDESPHRLQDLRVTCPCALGAVARAPYLPFRDRSFDTVITSQMLHEVELFGVELFGRPEETSLTVREIARVTRPGGRYLLLDHLDPGHGTVDVSLDARGRELLTRFADAFRYRPINPAKLGPDRYRLSKRDLQDFVTKIWSLGSPMETMEMEETHCVFTRNQVKTLLESAGFDLVRWIRFEPIRTDLSHHSIALVRGRSWRRKFLAVARRGRTRGLW